MEIQKKPSSVLETCLLEHIESVNKLHVTSTVLVVIISTQYLNDLVLAKLGRNLNLGGKGLLHCAILYGNMV